MTCKRKTTLVKKCNEIATLCNLKISLFIYDPEKQELIEHNSHEDFGCMEIHQKIQSHLQTMEDYRAMRKRNGYKPEQFTYIKRVYGKFKKKSKYRNGRKIVLEAPEEDKEDVAEQKVQK